MIRKGGGQPKSHEKVIFWKIKIVTLGPGEGAGGRVGYGTMLLNYTWGERGSKISQKSVTYYLNGSKCKKIIQGPLKYTICTSPKTLSKIVKRPTLLYFR